MCGYAVYFLHPEIVIAQFKRRNSVVANRLYALNENGLKDLLVERIARF